MIDNSTWGKLARPPKEVLKTINFGPLKGMTDIDPLWRIKIMSDTFGSCGVGWKYTIVKIWNEPSVEGRVFAFAEVLLFVKFDGENWSDGIPGVGGNLLIKTSNGKLSSNDDGYKMAVTDALGTAMRTIGVAADIYMGKFNGSKYTDELPPAPPPKKPLSQNSPAWKHAINAYRRDGHFDAIEKRMTISDENKKLIKEVANADSNR